MPTSAWSCASTRHAAARLACSFRREAPPRELFVSEHPVAISRDSPRAYRTRPSTSSSSVPCGWLGHLRRWTVGSVGARRWRWRVASGSSPALAPRGGRAGPGASSSPTLVVSVGCGRGGWLAVSAVSRVALRPPLAIGMEFSGSSLPGERRTPSSRRRFS